MKLREYQIDAVNALFNYFDTRQGNPVVALPTGTGKSLVIAEFIKRVLTKWRGQRILVLTHVKELIAQNHAELINAWPTAPAGIYSAGLNRREITAPVLFAGIASVNKKTSSFQHVDLIIIDECHLVSANNDTMYRAFINELRKINPFLKVIGLSATPYRLGLGNLTDGGLFTHICFDYTNFKAFNKLVDDGFMSPLITKKTNLQYAVDAVHIRGGEFVEHELQDIVDRDDLTERAVDEIVRLGQDRQSWLVFSCGIEHMIHTRDILRRRGITCEAVSSTMSAFERDNNILLFKKGKIKALVNNNILTTGFNYPEIDLICVLRPTVSTVLWVQMLGRGTRVAPNKTDCLVLDFAGNTRRLGPINAPVLPTRKGTKGGGTAPVKVCENCNCYCHASVTECPYCGAIFPRHIKISATSDVAEVMRREEPQIVDFTVSRITYTIHKKEIPSLKVSYYCGLRVFAEYICFEHKGQARNKAVHWWRVRTNNEVPNTVEQAFEQANSLPFPKKISVVINKKYPDIINYHFFEKQ